MADALRNTPEFRRWVRQKNRWLARVMFDGTLSPTARLVAFGIYKHLNDISHDAWMAQETLRRKLGIGNIRTVRAAVKALYRAGYIGMTFDPKTRNYTYDLLLAPSDDGETGAGGQGQIAPIPKGGQGQIAPTGKSTIGAISPSPIGAISTKGQGQIAPIPKGGQGQIAPTGKSTIGAISPSPIGAISTKGQGQIAPLSNINNYTKRRDREGGGVTEACRRYIELFEEQAADEGHGLTTEPGLTIEPDPIGDRWPIIQAAVVAKHGTRAKTYIDQLSLQGRVGDDIVLTAVGSFVRDLVRQDYSDVLTAAWRADLPDIKRVRIELAMQRAAQ